MANFTSLSFDEETKIKRIELLLNYLNKTEQIYFIVNNPYKFIVEDGSFRDSITDRVVSPSENMISWFYTKLCNDVYSKLQIEVRRTKIPSTYHLLKSFNKLTFLPSCI